MPSWYCSHRLIIARAQPAQETAVSVRSKRWERRGAREGGGAGTGCTGDSLGFAMTARLHLTDLVDDSHDSPADFAHDFDIPKALELIGRLHRRHGMLLPAALVQQRLREIRFYWEEPGAHRRG